MKEVSLNKTTSNNKSGTFLDKIKKQKAGRFSFKRLKKIRIAYILIFLVIAVVAGYFGKRYYDMRRCGDACGNFLGLDLGSPVNAIFSPKLDQDENGRTNVLLVGLDTRENGSLLNTDTVMLVTVDNNKKEAYMISIPRDMLVAYDYNGRSGATKLTSIYATVGGKDDPQVGIDGLKRAVSNLTGLEIQYHALVTLQGFRDVIDTIGGLKIDVPVTIDGKYPNEGASATDPDQWIYVHFEQGEQTMDGETALRYARTRNVWNPSSEGSDYARARRQQLVLKALKEQVLSTETLSKPDRIWEIYKIVEDNVNVSDFDLNDIRAAYSLANEIDNSKTPNVVLDPKFGNGKIVKANGEENGYTIEPIDKSYGPLREAIAGVMEYPEVYVEMPKVAIYNLSSSSEEKYNALVYTGKYPGEYIPAKGLGNDGTVRIYDFKNGGKRKSAEFLSSHCGVEVTKDIPEGVRATQGEDFAIVL